MLAAQRIAEHPAKLTAWGLPAHLNTGRVTLFWHDMCKSLQIEEERLLLVVQMKKCI